MSPTQLKHALEQMLTIRGFETSVQSLFHQGRIRGSVHLGIGQEAVAVGARLGTEAGDVVLPTYRGHNYALAWGIPLEEAFAEILGRETGCCHGRGGSKHLGDLARGVVPGNALVAAALPIACGTALAARLDGRNQVSVAAFGDGATNQAAFHEAMNLAAVWQLPVVFLLENNLYSEMTPIAEMVHGVQLVDRAHAYGMPAEQVDGMDVLAVQQSMAAAAARARSGGGPTLIEAMTYRFCGHMPGDTESYRSRDEVQAWMSRDPIVLAADELQAEGMTETDLSDLRADVAARLEGALATALEAPEPAAAALARGAAPWMEVTA